MEARNYGTGSDVQRNVDTVINAVARTYPLPKATLKKLFDSKNSYAVGHRASLVALEISLKRQREIEESNFEAHERMFEIKPLDLRCLA